MSSEPISPTPESPRTPTSYDPKIVAIVAYITLIGWIVALIMNNPKSALGSFHIRQSLGIMLLMLVCGVVAVVPVLGWITAAVGYLAGLVLWLFGLMGAIQGTQKPVPLIGEKFQEWFKAV
tara:strand:+ start:12699 stop:13061 length:363 start_codon:yes stop_codon:yes gene_type:complete